MKTKEDDLISRAELLQQAIATLQLMIQQIKAGGELALPGCRQTNLLSKPISIFSPPASTLCIEGNQL
ncbi:hypothetical protein LC612_42020 [Nostoc sp. CHAB 5834]|nr:hypothetical protein [Nostoc sp. CHAB 5834]